MATDLEIRERQKNTLFGLLKLKELNKNLKIVGLKDLIISAKVGMNKEDIADVEKNVRELFED
jgi:hypothetical protein